MSVFDAPLPLGSVRGDRQAMRLRSRGLSYPQLSVVMGEYHGIHRSGPGWRTRLRGLGAPGRPRGSQVGLVSNGRVTA